jgi:hypothetical protein
MHAGHIKERRSIIIQTNEDVVETSGFVPSITLELFGSILTGQKGKSGYGADLEGIEIKSAIAGSSFEYQYHLNTGLDKLKEDQVVDHFFCSYSADYQSFQVYFAEGKSVSPFFSNWIPQYIKKYNKAENATSRQRDSTFVIKIC